MPEINHYDIDIANNGKEAFEAITDQIYDLVLMDVQMPVMDGFEASQAIRQWEKKEEKNKYLLLR